MLLDQSIIAGIGNIYSDEILYAAGIHPEETCRGLRDSDWERLSEKIPEVITRAIRGNAMTPEEYLAGLGKAYRSTPFLKAYGHAGQPCAVCGYVLEKNDTQIRAFFESDLPDDYRIYGWYHWLILEHCINSCKKIPICEDCFFQSAEMNIPFSFACTCGGRIATPV